MTLYTTMTDACAWERIAAGLDAAVYDDGSCVCPDSVRSRWRVCLGITVFARRVGPYTRLGDCERLNASPHEFVNNFAVPMMHAGEWCGLYAGGTQAALEQELRAVGLAWTDPALWPLCDPARGLGIYLWSVDWTREPHLTPMALATQYAGNLPNGTDLSECYGTFPLGPAAPIIPPPPPEVSVSSHFLFREQSKADPAVYLPEVFEKDGLTVRYISSPAQLEDVSWAMDNIDVNPNQITAGRTHHSDQFMCKPGYRHSIGIFQGEDPLVGVQ